MVNVPPEEVSSCANCNQGSFFFTRLKKKKVCQEYQLPTRVKHQLIPNTKLPNHQLSGARCTWCKLVRVACKLRIIQHEWALAKHLKLNGTTQKSIDHRRLASHQHAKLSGEQHSKSDFSGRGKEGGLSRSGWMRTNMNTVTADVWFGVFLAVGVDNG